MEKQKQKVNIEFPPDLCQVMLECIRKDLIALGKWKPEEEKKNEKTEGAET